MSDLAKDPSASIVDLSKAFRNRSVSPSEVMEAQLVRIEAIDPKLGSYQSVYGDAALAAAKEADTAMYAMSRCPHRAHMYGAHVRRICAAHMWDECNPVRQTVTQTSKEADAAVQS